MHARQSANAANKVSSKTEKRWGESDWLIASFRVRALLMETLRSSERTTSRTLDTTVCGSAFVRARRFAPPCVNCRLLPYIVERVSFPMPRSLELATTPMMVYQIPGGPRQTEFVGRLDPDSAKHGAPSIR